MAQKMEIEDEVLELVWTMKETGAAKKEDILSKSEIKVTPEILEGMIKDDYLFEVNGELSIGENGKDRATGLIRAHRLAERLFVDVLELKSENIETNACSFEHILSKEVTRSICTLLGHPRECPHGRPIPMGECCRRADKEVSKIVLSLAELRSGESGKVVYILSKHSGRLENLSNLGVAPGQIVKILQTAPAFVVKASETDIAMDKDILKDIYVRKNEK